MILDHQRVAAKIVTEVLLELKTFTKPDVSLDMLDNLAERLILERGGTPYNKGYEPTWSEVPYPNTICCSVNHEIAHAPPRGRSLKTGDIVTYDIGVRYKTGCGDAALTVAVGKIDNRKTRLMRYALQTLYEGIKVVKAGAPLSLIGDTMDRFASLRGYTIIKEFGSHHIGKEMHEEPFLSNFYNKDDENKFLEEGKIICLEPILTPGNGMMAMNAEDKWTAFTTDYQPCAMFEAMMIIGKDKAEILTGHLSENMI